MGISTFISTFRVFCVLIAFSFGCIATGCGSDPVADPDTGFDVGPDLDTGLDADTGPDVDIGEPDFNRCGGG